MLYERVYSVCVFRWKNSVLIFLCINEYYIQGYILLCSFFYLHGQYKNTKSLKIQPCLEFRFIDKKSWNVGSELLYCI